jgi:hypothetical protein
MARRLKHWAMMHWALRHNLNCSAHEPTPMPHRETGFDAISMRGVANAWIRDVHVVNMDYGIQVRVGP